MKKSILVLGSLILWGCGAITDKPSASAKFDGVKLAQVLSAQDERDAARNLSRHPADTLAFFELAPGMTVIEMLPGQGWYSKILLPYLGEQGHLIGIDYALTMWPNFPFGSEAFLAERKNWPAQWRADALTWRGPSGPEVDAYTLATIPKSLDGAADAVLFIRALHNLARFEPNGGHLTQALQRTYATLKPGGLVGIVQHQVDESYPDAWADGSKGYLKASFVKRVMADAGFEFIGSSDVNENVKDKPSLEDVVWRLPPSFAGTEEGSAARQAMAAVGESNRMTLKFRKPY